MNRSIALALVLILGVGAAIFFVAQKESGENTTTETLVVSEQIVEDIETAAGDAATDTDMHIAGEDHEARVMHYEGATFANTQDALASVNEKTAEIAALLQQEQLEDSTLESVHEITYTLENAVDALRSHGMNDENVDALDEAVQALHSASENHDAEGTRQWFSSLEAAQHNFDVDDMESAEGASQDSADGTYEITIKNHVFTPETLNVPAGQKIKLIVDNQDTTPEEFESHDMSREKIIAGNTKATIFVGPLEPGKYHYFGEFNMDSANGYIVAE